MLDDFSEESLKNKYKEQSGFIMSFNLKRFFIEKEFLPELNSLNEFHKYLVKNRLNSLIKEKSAKKDSYAFNEKEIQTLISKANFLNFNYATTKNKFLLKNLLSESFAFSTKPEEIINSIVFWDKIFENLHYFSTFNLDNKLLSKENFDEKFFNQKFVEKYFGFSVIEIDDFYFQKINEEKEREEIKANLTNKSSNKKAFLDGKVNQQNDNANIKNFSTKKDLKSILNYNNKNKNDNTTTTKICQNNQIQNEIFICEKTEENEKNKQKEKEKLDISAIKKLFDGKSQKRRRILKLNQHFSYLPLDCNGFCGKLVRFIKKCFFAHLFKNEEFVNFNNNNNNNNRNRNNNIVKNLNNEVNEKFKDFTLNDFKELEILIYKNCLFAHNQNEINFHCLKYKTKYCKQNSCNFLTCEKVHVEESLGDELVLLYRKNSSNMKNLEDIFNQKMQEAIQKSNKKLLKKSKLLFNFNLNNLEEADGNESDFSQEENIYESQFKIDDASKDIIHFIYC